MQEVNKERGEEKKVHKRKEGVCKDCNKLKGIHAHGLCTICYNRSIYPSIKSTCKNCGHVIMFMKKRKKWMHYFNSYGCDKCENEGKICYRAEPNEEICKKPSFSKEK